MLRGVGARPAAAPDVPAPLLAQANIARCRYPLDDPRMRGFVDALDEVNAAADRAAGFVWRLQTREGNSTQIRAFEDDRILINISVWQSLEDLFAYVYRDEHLEILRERRRWFEVPEREPMVLWWHGDQDQPSVVEALFRLECLWAQGPTPAAFTFRHAYRSDGVPLPAGWNRRGEVEPRSG